MVDDLEKDHTQAGGIGTTILWQLRNIADEVKNIAKEVSEIRLSVKGDRLNPGLEEIAREHNKRLKSLEDRFAWLAGIGASVLATAVGYYITRILMNGGHP